jgi:phosphatidylinositol alpha-mannosyltransferase
MGAASWPPSQMNLVHQIADAPAEVPLRVAMISYYLPSESKIGVGFQVHELANAMVKRGHDVTVFSSCKASEGSRYKTETVPLHGSNRTFKFALKLRHIDWRPYDVLHAHGDDYWLWRRRVPAHIRTLHGSCLSEAFHIHGARERLRMFLLGLSEVLASVVADKATAVSENTRRVMPWVRTVVPNGIDLSRFHPGERNGTPVVLFVGTCRRRKRGHFLSEIFRREVLPTVPDAELWMVAEDCERAEGVKVLGRLSDKELADVYRRAWVFCLPSSYEGFGIPYVEAMASGCPVVATPNPGSLEVTANSRFGLVVEDDAVGQALTELLTSADERERMSAMGVERSREFDLAAVAARYENHYRAVLLRNNAALKATPKSRAAAPRRPSS